ncbi:MAG: inositol monophosphatase [Deltaproteobacteria bacterium]|nr:inositol monophosphatase [Deltaproteobacteria bacterium]
MPDFLTLACEVAKESGRIQRSNLGKVRHIEYKGEINLLTEVDKACEKMVIERLQGAFPDHDIMAEEGGGKRKDSDYKWIIDPLDGTTNFAHGYPLFCTSIALEHKGEIVLGVVYEPNHDELFCAEKGGGSFLNEKRIHVSREKEIGKSLLATGFAYDIKKTSKNNLDHFKNMLMASQAVRRDGVAAIDLCYTACGRYDGFWELNLFPWDVAAGILVITEAGGKVTDFSGKPFSVYLKEILASNGLIHEQMASVLRKSDR